MPRCKGRCPDHTRCWFLAMPGNYGFCGHHRGRKEPTKVEKPSKSSNVIKGNPFDYPASFWMDLGLKPGTALKYRGKTCELKMDCNKRPFWGAPVA